MGIGVWQLVLIGGVVFGIVLLVRFLSASARKKRSNKLSSLERLNSLKQSGALTDAEYEIEKRKVLD